ncbi:carboxy terminal-processing peptidase [Neolewinella lacunae]|uniref:Carboxy terminal-processing peptidase n=1 Tax=Neolewinella lacunae TaxID=1517758 RepID=A0A923T6M5_9BACT|nr:carboxy terminal-processing peptidase [Neolewinella lacunae]MBC6992649.1 carboxy terminal-processing peptidase [Neolewinella lacunae]MDN3633529.1 carboxy terminal-processing peptidase [Neolewinella lacunae]
MKFRGTILFSALFVVVAAFYAAYLPQATPPGNKDAVIIQTMMANLQRFHYQPKAIDDEFSQKVFDYYIDDMDGARLFFTAEDLAAFAPHKTRIDDEVNEGSYAFFDLMQERWTAALNKTQGYYREILAQPMDLNRGGEISLRDEKSDWVKSDKELRQYWADYLKRDVLNQVVDKLEENEQDEELTEKPTAAEIEVEVRAKTLERYDKWFERMHKANISIRRSQYLNALTAMFDPHTSYYRPKDKESFDISFSGRLEGIGATLQTFENYTKVATIVVGGPAWKGKDLQEDDVILAVRQGNEEESLDIKDMEVEDVVQFIRGDKGTTVHLKVRKPDGTIKEISIVRDIVVIDDRFAKSLIVDGPGEGEKIGYINLPSFYADFEHEDGHFSAKDIKLELDKLKDRDVDGIILDLRNNGGGSLKDVVDMTGFFIPQGPIVQVAGRGGQKEVLRDTDPKVYYDGPLVVLVNQYSASASEILAAALQDYQRAVIVGSTSTFGKGTVQRFIDLDRTIPGLAEVKPLGTVKLTMQKFYRIDGGSTQLRGVVPDIVLPDSRSLIETGERQQTGPLAWSKIDAAEYYQDVYRIDFMDDLRERSNNRVALNPTFQRIQENAKRVKRQSDQNTYPLSLAAYQALEKANQKEAEQYKDLYDQVVIPGVYNLDVDLEEIQVDESKDARNTDFKKGVSKDVYIQEALNIIHDMRQLRK